MFLFDHKIQKKVISLKQEVFYQKCTKCTKLYKNVQNVQNIQNCADAQNIVNLHICTTKYYVSPHFKIVKIHKILCIAQITLYCTQNIVNLYNYTNCIVLYTNCEIYARHVVRIMSIIL